MQAQVNISTNGENLPQHVLTRDYSRDSIYQYLMSFQQGLLNDHVLASMIASWYCDMGCLPAHLGLNETQWQCLLHTHFTGCRLPPKLTPNRHVDLSRAPELDDLRTLLLAYSTEQTDENQWIAEILIYGCLGSDHLWQDLGLWARTDLSRLIHDNFTALAVKNDRDMKWKKFFYKQLCIQEGIYVCRAPSCEVCSDYQNCFGTEE